MPGNAARRCVTGSCDGDTTTISYSQNLDYNVYEHAKLASLDAKPAVHAIRSVRPSLEDHACIAPVPWRTEGATSTSPR